ncbi:pentapeptide repeat-containing protein [Myxococcota bacterium]|nr:pentapeptide repeat-containing protein [Myxococcota bacterium]
MKRFNILAVASVLFAFTVMSGGVAGAASYQRTDGTIVDPILDLDGNVSSYTGPNLGPGQTIDSVDLSLLDLTEVDLSGSTFTNATFGDVILSRANFSQSQGITQFYGGVDATFAQFDFADLQGLIFAGLGGAINNFSGASFRGANLNGMLFVYLPGFSLAETAVDLSGADFSDAILTNVGFYAQYIGSPLYNANTDFTGATISDGNGVAQPFDPVAAGWTLVPEPSSSLLISLGLIGMSARKRTTSKTL